MELSISIVNWNVKEYLRRCLKSIYDTVENLSFEVIVVDNNSNDGTKEMVKNQFPPVRLIENGKNLGFAAANNQVIEQARGKYILLLNPDTFILPETIEGMVRFMNSHLEVGISSCRKVDENGNQDWLDLAIGKYNPFHFFGSRKSFKMATLDYLSDLFPDSKIIKKQLFNIGISTLDFTLCSKNKPVEVNVAWGSFMMIRKELIRQIGKLDERFFFAVEDMDFCYRAREAGWKIYFHPQYEIVHLGQKSISQWGEKDKIMDLITYSHFMFYNKHKGKIWLFFRTLKVISAKIIIRGFSMIVNIILLIRGGRSKRESRGLGLGIVSADIRNLFRVIFNITPQFNTN